MERVIHDNTAVGRHIKGFQACAKKVEEGMPIDIIPEDDLSFISPAGDMVERTRVFYANRSCQLGIDTILTALVNSERLPPYHPFFLDTHRFNYIN